MKKIVVLAFAAVFVLGAIAVYACGNDNSSSKSKSSAGTDVKQIQASVNTAEANVQTAQATVDTPACGAMKTDKSAAIDDNSSGQAKAMNADMKTANSGCPASAACPATCCKDGKNAKASSTEIKTSDDMKTVAMKVDDKEVSK